ncbi:MAG: tyrosine-type recombinase/integrase [Clostridia bacterium]|nr:tyrosine-type recombinase/integrase [Clostridia bacterium]
MKVKLSELPAAVGRYLSYKLSIQGASEKTVYEYSLDLKGFLQFVFSRRQDLKDGEVADLSRLTDQDIGSVKSQEIYEYLLYLAQEKGNQPAARARKLSAIKRFYAFLFEKEHSISEDVAAHIEAPKVNHALPKYLTVDESLSLLEAVQKNGGNNTKRDYCILTLFLNCGMRVSELCGISLGDISQDLSQIVVTGKGNKQRMIYLNAACQNALRAYLEERGGKPCKDPSALFVSRDSLRLNVKTVQWLVYKYLKLAGLGDRGFSVHKLRHTAATLMYQSGKVDVRVLKDILGHEQLNTTQIYTHVSNAQIREAVELNPLNAKKTEK